MDDENIPVQCHPNIESKKKKKNIVDKTFDRFY